MVHELGHVIVGRIFGQPGDITLTGLGGQAVREHGDLASWQRILVHFCGPAAGFLFIAVIVMVDGRPWNNLVTEWLKMPSLQCDMFLIDHIDKRLRIVGLLNPRGQFPIYDIALVILFGINLFINVMNLLPIIPMDGGMIFKEICVVISPRSGLMIAFFWSFGLALLMSIYLLVVTLATYGFFFPERYRDYYPFAFPEISLIVFASLAFQSLQAYRMLSARQRYADFMQDDDMSGPRHLSTGIVELEPKDPRDFAPRAPGSERPR
jgi:Zn-dependent protease